MNKTERFAFSIALILLLFAPTDAPAFPFGALVGAAGAIDPPHNRKQLAWRIPGPDSVYLHRDSIDNWIAKRSTNEVHGASCFAVGILPGVGFPEEDWDVFLLRVNLPAGRHRSVSFIDVGLVASEVDGLSTGLQLSGVWNRNLGSRGEFQIAGAANLCDGDFEGWQCAGLVNSASGGVEGLQSALVNMAERIDGVQLGLANFAQSGSGLQIGVFNWARSFTGVQIGAGNCIADSPVPFFPLVNVSF